MRVRWGRGRVGFWALLDCPGSGYSNPVTREWPLAFLSLLLPHCDLLFHYDPVLPLPHQKSLAPSEYVGARGPR